MYCIYGHVRAIPTYRVYDEPSSYTGAISHTDYIITINFYSCHKYLIIAYTRIKALAPQINAGLNHTPGVGQTLK